MRTKLKTTKDPIHKAFLMSVLDRRPPKLVLAGDAIDERDYEKKAFVGHVQYIREMIPKWAHEFGIEQPLWDGLEENASVNKGWSNDHFRGCRRA